MHLWKAPEGERRVGTAEVMSKAAALREAMDTQGEEPKALPGLISASGANEAKVHLQAFVPVEQPDFETFEMARVELSAPRHATTERLSALREKILAATPPKGTPCDCLNGPEGDAFRQALERHDTMYDLAATSFALSGAAAIFSVAYALWPVKKTVLAQPRTGMVMPVFTSREQGLVWRGEF